ncbi:unnamed protein product [Acanthocheilonema viteae]|uniref:UNC93-like protein MFSD11 n=1 Tax=Acanthocheilonema viteae TaxID=6277 RepID=A0A498SXX2_ACAVI|nr:unnamed protein product [Acanthocheilonema viteae]
MCITYFTFTLSTFIAPFVVSYLTAKWAMFFASVLYTTFMLAFMLINSYIFYITSALMGFAASLIWTGHGVYMKEITTSGNESRNSGLHWGINFISLLFGGVLLLVIFNKNGEAEMISVELIRQKCKIVYRHKGVPISCGCFVSFVSKHINNFGYMPTMFMALPLYLAGCLNVCLYFPKYANLGPTNDATYLSPSLSMWLIIGMLICISDSFWNTLRTAVLTKMYSHDSSSQIFALTLSVQPVGALSSYGFVVNKRNLDISNTYKERMSETSDPVTVTTAIATANNAEEHDSSSSYHTVSKSIRFSSDASLPDGEVTHKGKDLVSVCI